MRIIGGHDYYDSGLAWGQDEKLIFLRKEENQFDSRNIEPAVGITESDFSGGLASPEKNEKEYSFYRAARRSIYTKTHRYTVNTAHVILCGVLYNGLQVTKTGNNHSPDVSYHWIWNVEALKSFAKAEGLNVNPGKARQKEDWHYINGARKSYTVQILPIEEWLRPKKLEGKVREYLIDNKITIAIKNPDNDFGRPEYMTWDVNTATLKDVEFAKAVDPYTAFQEISMWIGGVIPQDGPKMVEITDNRVKIEKHGFHHPTSFRKAKTG